MNPAELGQLPWLAPTLGALFAWGFAQGLVKKYIGEVSAASFCLYYAVANAVVNVAFWAFHDVPPAFAPDSREFAFWGLLAYVLDGIAWIFYYQSLTYGPISIVGTLSAAYPALTVIFARAFLGEDLASAPCCSVAWRSPGRRRIRAPQRMNGGSGSLARPSSSGASAAR
jgi:drug/metabolite transporter (DMT)-like permease